MNKMATTPYPTQYRPAQTSSTRRVLTWLGLGLAYLFLILTAISMVFPFYWMVSTSLKPESKVFAYPPQWIPYPPVLTSYKYLFFELPFPTYLYNSVKVSLLWTLGVVL